MNTTYTITFANGSHVLTLRNTPRPTVDAIARTIAARAGELLQVKSDSGLYYEIHN